MTTLQNSTGLGDVLARLDRIQPGARARWGRMSAHQMLCHLSDSYRFALGERSASPATGPFQRTVMKWVALYLPIRWPKGIPTRPEMEQGRGGTGSPEAREEQREILRLLQQHGKGSRRRASDSKPPP